MGDLQQEVERFEGVLPGAVGVFQVHAAVFLDVKTLVFDDKAGASGAGCDVGDIAAVEAFSGNPGKGVGLTFGVGFLAKQSGEDMGTFVAIGIGDVVDPLKNLKRAVIHFDGLIRDGLVRNYADLARLGGVSRARITQIMNLLNLPPWKQEKLLFLSGSEVTERGMRKFSNLMPWR